MNHLIARTGFLAVCLAVCLAEGIATAQDAPVYKWIDGEGIPHYSDSPPADAAAEQMPIWYRRTDRVAVQARVKSQQDLTAATAIREQQEAQDSQSGEAERQKVLSERQAGCEQAKARAAKYAEARRLYRPGPDGERLYLSDEELDAERAAAIRAVADYCGE